MTAHTPGPWHVGPPPLHMPLNSVFSEEGILICSTGGFSSNVGDPEAIRLEQEANARLIATTPVLLEALDYCCRELEMLCPDTAGTPAAQHGRTIIAKARGEQL